MTVQWQEVPRCSGRLALKMCVGAGVGYLLGRFFTHYPPSHVALYYAATALIAEVVKDALYKVYTPTEDSFWRFTYIPISVVIASSFVVSTATFLSYPTGLALSSIAVGTMIKISLLIMLTYIGGGVKKLIKKVSNAPQECPA